MLALSPPHSHSSYPPTKAVLAKVTPQSASLTSAPSAHCPPDMAPSPGFQAGTRRPPSPTPGSPRGPSFPRLCSCCRLTLWSSSGPSLPQGPYRAPNGHSANNSKLLSPAQTQLPKSKFPANCLLHHLLETADVSDAARHLLSPPVSLMTTLFACWLRPKSWPPPTPLSFPRPCPCLMVQLFLPSPRPPPSQGPSPCPTVCSQFSNSSPSGESQREPFLPPGQVEFSGGPQASLPWEAPPHEHGQKRGV